MEAPPGWLLLGGTFALGAGVPTYRAWVNSHTPEAREPSVPTRKEPVSRRPERLRKTTSKDQSLKEMVGASD
jgi:hypothetical protein